MALRVWLPLNGNLENQGLSNVNITNNGATIDNNGKIGKCYSFGSSKRIAVSQPDNLSISSASLSCWVNLSSWESSYDSLVNLSTGTGWNDTRLALVRNNTANRIGFCIANGSTYNYVVMKSDLPLNTWTHLAGTFDGSTIKIYVNGILNNSLSATFRSLVYESAILNLGSWSNGNNYPINGKLNDVRLYDHCLSPKEVKEISKGLCLHYKLTGPGGENFILESHRVTSGGASTGITRSYTSEGYLKVVSTSGNGNWCNLGFAKDSNENVGNKLSIGDTYTMSVEIKVENGTILPNIFINNGNSYKLLKGTIKTNQWAQYSYTAVWNDPGTSYGNISLHLGFSAAIGTYYFRNFKLEKGSVATPWCPAPGDALYKALGYNNNIEYDCSGYGHNGTKSGTITWDSDSPRYATSYKLNTANIVGPIPNTLKPAESITMAMWVKLASERTSGELTLFNNYESGGAGLDISGTSYGMQIYSGGYKAAWVDMAGKMTQWHHFAGIFDGNNIKTYIDGKLKATVSVTAGSTISYNSTTPWSIGINPGPNGGSGGMIGNVSDARIYATALSDADILELYETGGAIDSHYNSYVYEYITDNSNEYLNSQGISGISDLEEIDENTKWLSTGIIESNNFYEI